jgi:hypothetical protein
VDEQFSPLSWDIMDEKNLTSQETGSSLEGAYRQGPVEGSKPGELQGSGDSEGATGREPSSVCLESGKESRHSGFTETKKEPVRDCQAVCAHSQADGGQWPGSAASGQPTGPVRNLNYGCDRGTHNSGRTRHGCTWSLG